MLSSSKTIWIITIRRMTNQQRLPLKDLTIVVGVTLNLSSLERAGLRLGETNLALILKNLTHIVHVNTLFVFHENVPFVSSWYGISVFTQALSDLHLKICVRVDQSIWVCTPLDLFKIVWGLPLSFQDLNRTKSFWEGKLLFRLNLLKFTIIYTHCKMSSNGTIFTILGVLGVILKSGVLCALQPVRIENSILIYDWVGNWIGRILPLLFLFKVQQSLLFQIRVKDSMRFNSFADDFLLPSISRWVNVATVNWGSEWQPCFFLSMIIFD